MRPSKFQNLLPFKCSLRYKLCNVGLANGNPCVELVVFCPFTLVGCIHKLTLDTTIAVQMSHNTTL